MSKIAVVYWSGTRCWKRLFYHFFELLRSRFKATNVFGTTGWTYLRLSRLISTIMTSHLIPTMQAQ